MTYFYDCYTILNKVYSDKTFFKQALSSTTIEEKNRALTVKTCYGVLDRDIELSYYLKILCPKSPKLVIRTILKISFYAIKYLEKKPYAVTENAVELTKKLGKGGMAGFVNAVLRKFSTTEIKMPTDKAAYLSVKYSYPEFAVDKLLKTYGETRTEKIISSVNPFTSLVFYEINGQDYLDALSVSYRETPFDNVFLVRNFVRNDDYDKGVYTYQSIGSVAICDVVSSCDSLLDCCAAPGGKSVRLSYKCKKVTSWDIHPHRVALIESYAKRMGRNNIAASVVDAKEYVPSLDKSFDAVLVDAPCSGLGVTNDNPDIKLNRSLSDVEELTREQDAILNNVKNYVKRGGYLYYSTCSVLYEENYGRVKDFLEKNPEFVLEKINSPLPHEDVNGTNVFLPDISFGVGFFVAKMKRI